MSLRSMVPEGPYILKVHLPIVGNTLAMGSVRFSGSMAEIASTCDVYILHGILVALSSESITVELNGYMLSNVS